MGVTGLWKVLDSTGHPIKLEALERKVLAVDANIWLYRFIKGFRDRNDAINIDAHKIGLFVRLCKLLFYKIRPIFVFDGPAPQLKRRTLEQRQERRNKGLARAQGAALKLLVDQLKNNYPDADLSRVTVNVPTLVSHGLVAANKLGDDDLEMFRDKAPNMLTPLDEDSEDQFEDNDDDVHPVSSKRHIHRKDAFGKADYLSHIDIDSVDFQRLPPEVRHEILTSMKESKKRHRSIYSLPEEAGNFSNLQLDRLRQRREIQKKIEEAEQEICSSVSGQVEIDEFKDKKRSIVESYRVISDSNKRMLYLKNLSEQKASVQQNVMLESGKTPEDLNDKERPPNLTPIKSSLKDYLDQEKKTDFSQISRGLAFVSSKLSRKPKKRVVKKDVPVDQLCLSSSDSDSSSEEKQDPVLEDKSSISLISEADISNSNACDTQTKKIDDENPIQDPKIIVDYNEPHIKVIDLCDDETSSDDDESDGFIEILTSNETEEPEANHDEDVSKLQESDQHQSNDFKGTEKQIENDQDKDRIVDSEISIVPDTEKNDDTAEISIDEEVPAIASTSKTASLSVEELVNLKKQMNRDERHSNSMTDKIIRESKELLQLFGVPFIVAHGEAEAQCAMLELMKMTDGTITDDSDVWLFGAQTVYRHFFSDDKWIMQYKMSDIYQHLHLTRENLVCMAMMVGSDYTVGVDGVGPVTALEVLSEFKGKGMKPLKKFKHWMNSQKGRKNLISKTREHFLRLALPEQFPSRAVFNGYMHPPADESREPFSWGKPQFDELHNYAERNFGWSDAKIEEHLSPVIKKVNEKQAQTRIDSFFTKAPMSDTTVRSKRVNAALNVISRSPNTQRKRRKRK